MGRNKIAMKTQPCQKRREPAGRKRSAATKMTAMRLRRISRAVRLREVDIGFDASESDKERVAEVIRRTGYESLTRSGYASMEVCACESRAYTDGSYENELVERAAPRRAGV